MPINPNIPLQAANIPQIRYQPESQFESFAKIQPTLNAMQQMRQQAVAARGAAQIEEYMRSRGHNINLGELGALMVRVGKTEEGARLIAADNERKQIEAALSGMGLGQQAAEPTGVNAMAAAPSANAMAQPATAQPSVPSPAVTAPAMPATAPSMAPQGQPTGFRPTPMQLAQLAASGQAGGRVASALAPFAEKPQPVPEEIRTMRAMGLDPQNMEDVKRFYAAKQPQLATAEARLELDRRRLALDDLRARLTQTRNEAELAKLQAQINQQERKLALEERKFDRESDPDYQARISGARAFATEAAKNDATFAQQAPSALQGGEQTLALLNRMVGDPKAKGAASQPHPGFIGVVGATVTPGMRFVQGSSEADFDAMLEQVLGGAFLEAYERLKGTGQITEIEGKKATQAITRMQRSVSESEFLQAAKEFRQSLERAMERTRNRLQNVTAKTSAPASATQAPAGASSRGAVGREQSYPAPPQQAVDALLRGAGTDAQFDEIFGPGAAARARGR